MHRKIILANPGKIRILHIQDPQNMANFSIFSKREKKINFFQKKICNI